MKFEETEVFNFRGALRGMRNPMESWKKSDSTFDREGLRQLAANGLVTTEEGYIGPNDLKLAQTLVRAGSDHRKFMRQIFVCVDITAPLYWWKEFDTYGVGVVKNSTSTMHKLASTGVTFDRFEDINKELFELNDKHVSDSVYDYLNTLERLRRRYTEDKNKTVWKLLIKLLPESWLQTRTVTFDYENLLSIAHSDRKNHKLTEWCTDFFDWMRTLPYAEKLIFLDLNRGVSRKAITRLENLASLVDRECMDFYAIAEEINSIIDEIKEN